MMKKETFNREDDRLEFYGEGSMAGYAVAAAIPVLLAGALLWWWPDAIYDLVVAPWQRDEWSHTGVITGSVFLLSIGGAVLTLSGFLADRKQRHKITFDSDHRIVSVVEWWRDVKWSLELGGGLFSEVALRRPPEDSEHRELGVVLANGSFWRLFRAGKLAATQVKEWLEEIIDQLPSADSAAPEFPSVDSPPPELPERIDVDDREGLFQVSWYDRERTSARVASSIALLWFTAGAVHPVLVAFDGSDPLLWAALVIGAVAFGIPSYSEANPSVKLICLAGWVALIVTAVAWLGAHWAYYPIATMGLALFSAFATDIVAGFSLPARRSIRVENDRLYHNGQLVEHPGGNPVDATQLEAAIVNLTEIRPAKMKLVGPRGKETNRAEYLDEPEPQPPEPFEPIELAPQGLSPFELIALSLVIDDRLESRSEKPESNSAD